MIFLPRCLQAFALAGVFLFAWADNAIAVEPTAVAAFTPATTVVGEPVQFEVRVNGSLERQPAPEIRVEGVDFQFLRPEVSTGMNIDAGGATITKSVGYLYRATPSKPGVFTVPPVQVEVGARRLFTEPVALTVQAAGSGDAGGGRTSFAEIVVPKPAVYVGEMVPVEVRLFLAAGVRWNLEQMPMLEGEGFTKTKLSEPRQERSRRDGRDFEVLVFRAVITPGKAGLVKLGPADLNFSAQVPRARSNRARGLRDLFSNDFFNDPTSPFAAMEPRKARAEAVDLQVKPLPGAGVPAGFQGAVGEFTISAEASPRQLNVGDPLTATVRVKGKGNFDRLGIPSLADPAGWRTYPPTQNFQPEDELGTRGTKTFEIAAIPETNHKATPIWEFAYFDPSAEKYVTLRTGAAPLDVRGSLPPPPPAIVATPSTVAPSAPPVPAEEGFRGLRYTLDPWGSWTPLYRRPAFWLWQILPLAAVAYWGFRRFSHARSADAESRTWARELAATMRTLSREQDPAQVLGSAARALQLRTSLDTGRNPATIDAPDIRRHFSLAGQIGDDVDEIFGKHAELLFAGAGVGFEGLPSDVRSRIIGTVQKLVSGK